MQHRTSVVQCLVLMVLAQTCHDGNVTCRCMEEWYFIAINACNVVLDYGECHYGNVCGTLNEDMAIINFGWEADVGARPADPDGVFF